MRTNAYLLVFSLTTSLCLAVGCGSDPKDAAVTGALTDPLVCVPSTACSAPDSSCATTYDDYLRSAIAQCRRSIRVRTSSCPASNLKTVSDFGMDEGTTRYFDAASGKQVGFVAHDREDYCTSIAADFRVPTDCADEVDACQARVCPAADECAGATPDASCATKYEDYLTAEVAKCGSYAFVLFTATCPKSKLKVVRDSARDSGTSRYFDEATGAPVGYVFNAHNGTATCSAIAPGFEAPDDCTVGVNACGAH
jgi:hypothetical protein